jgi:biotin synthase-like enzyme
MQVTSLYNLNMLLLDFYMLAPRVKKRIKTNKTMSVKHGESLKSSCTYCSVAGWVV